VSNRATASSSCFNYAIAMEEGEATMLTLSHPAMNRIDGKIMEDKNRVFSRQSVPTIPIKKIFHDEKVRHIDLFSIDVEGSEYEVLSTMDWDISVSVFLIEIKNRTSANAPKNEICRGILRDRGYAYHSSTRTDEVWVDPFFEYSSE